MDGCNEPITALTLKSEGNDWLIRGKRPSCVNHIKAYETALWASPTYTKDV